MDINPIHMLLLDLEDHQSYVRDALRDEDEFRSTHGYVCDGLKQNTIEARKQVEEIRKQIKELS